MTRTRTSTTTTVSKHDDAKSRVALAAPGPAVSGPLQLARVYLALAERGMVHQLLREIDDIVSHRPALGTLVDVRSPLAACVQLPRSYVILQRINLGLYALLGELYATADWRRIAEEIWPFVQAPPSIPIGMAEAGWRASTP